MFYLLADRNPRTLIIIVFERFHMAQRGENGRGANCTGARGKDLVWTVPVGTVQRTKDTGEVLVIRLSTATGRRSLSVLSTGQQIRDSEFS